MPVIVIPATSHQLHHVGKPRHYTFRVGKESVQVERWAEGNLDYRKDMAVEDARWLYGRLLKQGYERW